MVILLVDLTKVVGLGQVDALNPILLKGYSLTTMYFEMVVKDSQALMSTEIQA